MAVAKSTLPRVGGYRSSARAWLSALGLLVLMMPNPGRALSLSAGDILVVNTDSKSLIRVDPVSGAQAVVSQGGVFQSPGNVEVDAAGRLLVSDSTAKAVFEIDPDTGAQTVFLAGATLGVIGTGGDFFTAVRPGSGATELLRIDPSTGASSVFASPGHSGNPAGIGTGPSGDILLGLDSAHGSSLLRIDGESAAISILLSSISGGLAYNSLRGVIEGPDGAVFLSGSQTLNSRSRGHGLWRIDPATGAVALLGDEGPSLIDLAFDASGNLLGTEFGGKVIRVDPVTGSREVVSEGGLFPSRGTRGLAIVPQLASVPEPASGWLSIGAGGLLMFGSRWVRR